MDRRAFLQLAGAAAIGACLPAVQTSAPQVTYYTLPTGPARIIDRLLLSGPGRHRVWLDGALLFDGEVGYAEAGVMLDGPFFGQDLRHQFAPGDEYLEGALVRIEE